MSIYSSIFYAGQNPPELNMRSFCDTILRFYPMGSAPLLSMMGQTAAKSAKATNHGYFSKTMQFSRVTVTVAADDSATALTVAALTDAGIVPGMVLHNFATGENLRVTGITGNTGITVSRGFGRIAADAIAQDAVLVVIGNAQDEGSARPNPRSIKTVYVSTFTQIFRNAWALTDTARASYAEAGYKNIAENKRDCMEFHAIDQESAMFFSQAYMAQGSNGTPLHATQGIIDAIRQHAPLNVTAMANPNAVTYDDMVDALLPAFSQSSNMSDNSVRVAYGDTTAIRTLQEMGKEYGEVTVTQRENSFGMVFDEFKFFKGRLVLREHPLFIGLDMTDGLLVVVDLPAISLAYMDGRNAKAENFGVGGGENNHGAPRDATKAYSGGHGVDAVGGSLTSEWALELLNPQGCAVITGLLGAAKRVIHTKVINTEAEPVITEEVAAP